ncbi:hypothetical protein ACPYO6_04680 [Georgenia sp. Z1344]|uniref:hypothetical protein n=1 Tax=Georgenia sp. Z1344 TaxID=3416706 RepID=UPI003CF93F64
MRLSRRPSVVSGDGPSLASSSRLMVDTAMLLVRVVGATTADVPELDEQVGDIARSTDRLGEEVTDRLVGDLVLPFERGDLHRVLSAQRVVVRTLLRVSRTLLADRSAPTHHSVVHAADEVLRAAELVGVATGALRATGRLADIARETARVREDLEASLQRAVRTASTSATTDRSPAAAPHVVLAALADAVAGCADVVVDMRILAAGAGRR